MIVDIALGIVLGVVLLVVLYFAVIAAIAYWWVWVPPLVGAAIALAKGADSDGALLGGLAGLLVGLIGKRLADWSPGGGQKALRRDRELLESEEWEQRRRENARAHEEGWREYIDASATQDERERREAMRREEAGFQPAAGRAVGK